MDDTLSRAPVSLLCRSLDGGGAERVMVALAEGLAAAGHPVDLVLLRGKAPRALSGAVRVESLAAAHPALAAPAFFRYLQRARPRSVLATLVGPNAIAVACARLLPPEQRPRVVVREANTLSVALNHRPRGERLLAGAMARAAYPLADRIVAVSEGARADLVHFLGIDPARVVSIPNPSPTAAILQQAAEPLDHPWFSSARTLPVVVAAGRLVRKKGFAVLLEAMMRVEARLYLMGEGPERPALEREIARRGLRERIELAGFVDNPFARLARADLFVLSSLAEGMPNVLIEALACGCPVVATDCPSGPREILRGGLDGPLVTPGDAGALAGAMTATLAAPPPREALRSRAADFDAAGTTTAYARVMGLA